MADWYYIGHYGQLGPLTLEQIGELVQGGVIQHETYVWRTGQASWDIAANVGDLKTYFQTVDPLFSSPPPPPPSTAPSMQASPVGSDPMRWTGTPATSVGYSQTSQISTYGLPQMQSTGYLTVRSEKSRVAAGILNLLIPGVGRMYMGYAAIGVLQLVFSPCGVGWIWSFVDGILILSGTPKLDGYGRVMDR